MKYLLLIFFSLILDADMLNTRDRNHCIINLEPNQNNSGWCYHDQNQDRDECDRRLDLDDLIDGYEYIDDECVLKTNLKLSGLTQKQWSFQLALMANLLGFTFVFMLLFLAVLTARK